MKLVPIVLLILAGAIANTVTAEKSSESAIGETSHQFDLHKKIISISNVPIASTSPYNLAIQFGQILYLSGQLGRNLTTGQLISDDTQNQTYQALHNIQDLLHAAGSDITKLLQCRVYLTDINDYQVMNQVYAAFFSSTELYPARATVAVTALASNAKVEIECTAFTTRSTSNFIVSSIAMLVVLPMGVGTYVYALWHDNPYTTNQAFCKLRTYALQSMTMIYRWCIVAACVDRCISISTNARLRNFASVRIAQRVTLLIVVVWLTLPIQVLALIDLRNDRCGVLYNVGLSLYFSFYTITTGSILPVSIMIICAVLISRSLEMRRQHRRQLAVNQYDRLDRKRDRQAFVMLLFQAIVFLITQTPLMLLFFCNAATIHITNKSANQVAIERFTVFMVDMILYLFPTISFYLYTMASRQFRREFIELFRSAIKPRRQNNTNQVNPVLNEIL
ncbi:unnamed protein product [Adineta ricciae]|uniref:G-protein coupled receptors family 1 profile domain-containing protein n=1 Tax=Adineta ricciae TaxID=249248 RepID=A0A813Z1K9_ADIRI|nr:unnamed protein product [Adineta ricciae]